MLFNVLGRYKNRVAVVLEYCVAGGSVSVDDSEFLYINRVEDLFSGNAVTNVNLQRVGCFCCRTIHRNRFVLNNAVMMARARGESADANNRDKKYTNRYNQSSEHTTERSQRASRALAIAGARGARWRSDGRGTKLRKVKEFHFSILEYQSKDKPDLRICCVGRCRR